MPLTTVPGGTQAIVTILSINYWHDIGPIISEAQLAKEAMVEPG
jgi:hypothetical protein